MSKYLTNTPETIICYLIVVAFLFSQQQSEITRRKTKKKKCLRFFMYSLSWNILFYLFWVRNVFVRKCFEFGANSSYFFHIHQSLTVWLVILIYHTQKICFAKLLRLYFQFYTANPQKQMFDDSLSTEVHHANWILGRMEQIESKPTECEFPMHIFMAYELRHFWVLFVQLRWIYFEKILFLSKRYRPPHILLNYTYLCVCIGDKLIERLGFCWSYI